MIKYIGIIACSLFTAGALALTAFGMYTFANLPVVPPEITYYTSNPTVHRVEAGGNWGQFVGLGWMILVSLILAGVGTVVVGVLAETPGPKKRPEGDPE